MKIPADSFTFEIAEKDGQKGIKVIAQKYYRHFLSTQTNIGDKGTMHLDFKKPTRSGAQLRYYFAIVGLISAYTGDTKEEMHDILVSIKFGTKKVKRFGHDVEVRRSVSDAAKMKKDEMAALVDFALEKCVQLEIKVPTKQELGYIDDTHY